jgi:predicted alpha/beta hydrolase family esterase
MMNLLIIPGNPSVRFYYESWVRELQLNEQINATVVYLPKFSIDLPSNEYIELVIEYYEEQLRKMFSINNQKVVVIGHSIGAFIAKKIATRNYELINKCFFLFPFFVHPGLKGKLVLKTVNTLNKNEKLSKVVKKYKRYFENLKDELRYVELDEIDSSLALAYHEHHVMNRNKHITIHPSINSNTIYCDNDTWCSFDQLKLLKMHTRLIKTMNAKHDFIISPEQRKEITTLITKNL